MIEPIQSDQSDRLAAVLGDVLAHAATETPILARLEEFFSPQPAKLAASEDAAKALNSQVDRLEAIHGGAPRLIILGINDSKPKYDTYMSAALDEVIEGFKRARRSICRAQAFMIGAHMLRSNPEFLNLPSNVEVQRAFQNNTEAVFWEHAETSFIRLAGYWDRIGQVLDFAFFSIRQYERDGFSAVVDRIQANVLRMHPYLEKTESWRAVWSYKKSESENGLQWLLSRRNLLVHSLYLRAAENAEDNELFESAFNHLDVRLRNKLAPGTPEKEVERLHAHLSQAAALLPHILTLCELHAKRRCELA